MTTEPSDPIDPGSAPVSTPWLVLVAQLPDDASGRMRILRMLDAMGCAMLRDGVFIMPEQPSARQGLQRLGQHISSGGGSHHLLSVASDAAQHAEFSRLFDRGSRYANLLKTIDGLRSGVGVADPTAMSRLLIKLKREFEGIAVLDFFPSDSQTQARQALLEVETEIRNVLFPPERDLATTQQMRTRQKFFKRVWVTRKPLWVDRLASAWLIRRFIDTEGTINWLERGETPSELAVSFGFEGAMFSNSSSQVTYEVLLDAFGLASDAALKRIAGIVHALDIGGAPVPEAAGVETLLQGAQRRAPDESALLPETEKTFDLLYDAYFQAPVESSSDEAPQ